MIFKTESGRVGYWKKYRVAGRVRVPVGHCPQHNFLLLQQAFQMNLSLYDRCWWYSCTMHCNVQNNCTIGSVLMKVPSALIAHLRLQAVTMTLLGKVESYINTLHHCSKNREILHSSKDQISSMRKPQGQLFFWLVRLAIEVSDNNCLAQWFELCFRLYWGVTCVYLK